MLFLLAVGLCGYSLWRLLDAFLDPEGRGTSAKGLVVRIGSAFRALVYGGLGIEAFRLARGLRSSRGSDATIRMWTATVMALAAGYWLIALVGAHHCRLRRVGDRRGDSPEARRQARPRLARLRHAARADAISAASASRRAR